MTAKTPAPEPLAVTQAEAARLFGVTPQTVRRWELRGLIRGERFSGGPRFYSYAAVKRLVEKGDGIASQTR